MGVDSSRSGEFSPGGSFGRAPWSHCSELSFSACDRGRDRIAGAAAGARGNLRDDGGGALDAEPAGVPMGVVPPMLRFSDCASARMSTLPIENFSFFVDGSGRPAVCGCDERAAGGRGRQGGASVWRREKVIYVIVLVLL